MTDPSELAKDIERALCWCSSSGTSNRHNIECPANSDVAILRIAGLVSDLEADLASALENIHQSVEVEAELRLDLQGLGTENANLEAHSAQQHEGLRQAVEKIAELEAKLAAAQAVECDAEGCDECACVPRDKLAAAERERDEAGEVNRKYGLALIMIAGEGSEADPVANRDIARAALRLADGGDGDG